MIKMEQEIVFSHIADSNLVMKFQSVFILVIYPPSLVSAQFDLTEGFYFPFPFNVSLNICNLIMRISSLATFQSYKAAAGVSDDYMYSITCICCSR